MYLFSLYKMSFWQVEVELQYCIIAVIFLGVKHSFKKRLLLLNAQLKEVAGREAPCLVKYPLLVAILYLVAYLEKFF